MHWDFEVGSAKTNNLKYWSCILPSTKTLSFCGLNGSTIAVIVIGSVSSNAGESDSYLGLGFATIFLKKDVPECPCVARWLWINSQRLVCF